MNRKMSMLTIIYCLALGITIIASASISGGPYLASVMPVGTGMILVGPAMVLLYRNNAKKFERDCDEREGQITDKSMKFTFYFMTFVLSAYWAYDTTGAGTLLRVSSLIYCLLWGSFLGAYIVNKTRL